jgi:nicotinate-nucleotide pyrophosphorylase (carboxylating)
MIPRHLMMDTIERALDEDLAAGDLTTSALLTGTERAKAYAIAKRPLVACGSEVFAAVFLSVDPGVRVEELVADGEAARRGARLYCVEGSASSLLMAERTALNFVQRLSGIATFARACVDALPAGSTTRITDTRKTSPGLRAFERYAVRTGGASNHRDSLGAGVLIKENHIHVAGGVAAAVARARRAAPHTSRVEIEVTSLDELDEALAAGADIVMLDNFETTEVARAVARASGRAILEVSGGVTLERIPDLAKAGVDVISVGALTHSAPAADIALDLEMLG